MSRAALLLTLCVVSGAVLVIFVARSAPPLASAPQVADRTRMDREPRDGDMGIVELEMHTPVRNEHSIDAAPEPPGPIERDESFRPIDWSDWQSRPRPPRSRAAEISGLVLMGREPVASARIRAWPSDTVVQAGAERPGSAYSTTTDVDGRFTLTSIAPGGWTVEASTDGRRTQCQVRLPPEPGPSEGALIVFGISSLEATVYDDNGTPLPGVHTYFAGIGPAPARFAGALTDDLGRVRFEGLTSGRYHVIANRVGSFDSPGQTLVEIETGARQHVTLGNESAPMPFSGQIVDAEGAPRSLGENLRAVHAGRGDERWIRVSGTTFEASLTPGLWAIHRVAGLRLGERIGEVRIADAAVSRDIVLPVTRSSTGGETADVK